MTIETMPLTDLGSAAASVVEKAQAKRQEDQWAWWQSALDGRRGELTRGDPKSGFYRDRNRACAIWRDEDGKLFAAVSSGFCPTDPDQIDEAFGFWSMNPITHETYEFFTENGRWPDEPEPVAPRGIGDNQPELAPHEAIRAEINDHVENARRWIKEIGGKVVTQAHADKASNYAAAFAALEKRAEDARKEEKRPHDEAGKAVQAKWAPIVDLADEKKRWMKKATEDFLKAERARAVEIERKQREEEAARRAQGEEMPERAPPPPKPRAGTKATVALRTRQVHHITDIKALAAYIAAFDPPLPDFMEACQRAANRMCAAGVKPPGVETKQEEYAA